MLPRERQMAAIRHQVPDRIPLDVITIETCPEIAAYLRLPTDDIATVYDALGIDGRSVGPPYTGPLPPPVRGFQLNQWGTADGGPYGSTEHNPVPLADAETVADIERYPWPDARDYDYAAAATAAQRAVERYATRGPGWLPLFWRACELWGFEDAMLTMLDRPALFEGTIECLFQHVYTVCERTVAACGDTLDIFVIKDDFATQNGLMISPGHWRKYLKPYYARLFEIGKRAGKPVWFHSCGNILPVLPDLIDIGMDVWETVQLHTLPISARQLKQEYGHHITFNGGINTQALPFGSPRSVRDEVLRRLEELGEGGGFICGPDHHIKPDVPPENSVALFQTVREFRRAGYTTAT